MITFESLPEAKKSEIRRADRTAVGRVKRYEKALLAFLVEAYPSLSQPGLPDALAREYVKKVAEYEKAEYDEVEKLFTDAIA